MLTRVWSDRIDTLAKPLVSDDLWDVVAPLSPRPRPKPKGGRPPIPERAAPNGIPREMVSQGMGCGAGMTCGRRLRDWRRGRWIDYVFIERLWRCLKYEAVYLKGDADGREARTGIGAWFAFYNTRRAHQALANRTPMAAWHAGVTGALGEKAVDGTLRLDNSGALLPCPQPPRPQQALIASGIHKVGTAQLPTEKPVRVVP
jgi:hypothetical protein